MLWYLYERKFDGLGFEEPPSDEWPNGAGAWLLPGPLARRGDSTLQTDALPLAWPSGPWRGTPCGDVNADGIADLCLATGIDLGPVTAGSTPDVTWSAADPAEARVDGGLRVERADLDGDGGVELLLWNPVASAVHRLTAFPAGDHDPAALAASTWTAAPGVGTALAASGDLTGDGAEDFVVGWTDGAAPHVYVASGTAGGLLEDGHATIELPAAALAVGDFDADGHDDLAVGGDGTVRIFRGPLPAGSVDADTAAAWWMGQEYPTDRFGDALAAGDVDGDGRDDLLVGAPSSGVAEEVSPQPNGAVYVLSGGDL